MLVLFLLFFPSLSDVMKYYTMEQLDFLKVGYSQMILSDLTIAFNKEFGLEKSEGAIRSTLGNRRYLSGRHGNHRKGGGSFRYSQEQLEFLREGYKTLTIPELARSFNDHFALKKSDQAIQGAIKLHGFATERGRGIPHSEIKALGSERVSSSTGFVWIKVDEPDPHRGGKTRYKLKHKVIWEESNGPVPEGHFLRFLDGNKQNCALENLALFDRIENAVLNHLRFNEAPQELRESIILTARLKARTKKRQSELSGARDLA